MKNLETPKTKLALFGVQGSVGNALLVESLGRQFETSVILSDLNAVTARPGIRAKQGDLFDPIGVSRSVAGMDGVICILSNPHLAAGADDRQLRSFDDQFVAIGALLDGLVIAGVRRLLLVGDFSWLDYDEQLPSPTLDLLEQRLLDSSLAWTLVDAPAVAEQLLEFDDFAHPHEGSETSELEPLRRFAAGVLDEFELANHIHERIRLTDHREVSP
ncbi:NAD(P)H-binding protein [Pseudomonas sp. UL073]|uniref:NAD(P)H-binding protein n=1 Tax=Zestomonas insulae TaxID=2809017 RepID=A0ABS2IIB9_9GAMM|nr:NAD(P)H-binding protein [Pseudomonas insulae]MBM7061913.1 NAD(P)H-binding protein [Pseudomonas insulae]